MAGESVADEVARSRAVSKAFHIAGLAGSAGFAAMRFIELLLFSCHDFSARQRSHCSHEGRTFSKSEPIGIDVEIDCPFVAELYELDSSGRFPCSDYSLKSNNG